MQKTPSTPRSAARELKSTAALAASAAPASSPLCVCCCFDSVGGLDVFCRRKNPPRSHTTNSHYMRVAQPGALCQRPRFSRTVSPNAAPLVPSAFTAACVHSCCAAVIVRHRALVVGACRFEFASLQSPFGRALLKHYNLPLDVSTVVLFDKHA